MTPRRAQALAQAWYTRDAAARAWEAAKRCGRRGAAREPYERLREAERAIDALRARLRGAT